MSRPPRGFPPSTPSSSSFWYHDHHIIISINIIIFIKTSTAAASAPLSSWHHDVAPPHHHCGIISILWNKINMIHQNNISLTSSSSSSPPPPRIVVVVIRGAGGFSRPSVQRANKFDICHQIWHLPTNLTFDQRTERTRPTNRSMNEANNRVTGPRRARPDPPIAAMAAGHHSSSSSPSFWYHYHQRIILAFVSWFSRFARRDGGGPSRRAKRDANHRTMIWSIQQWTKCSWFDSSNNGLNIVDTVISGGPAPIGASRLWVYYHGSIVYYRGSMLPR